jgi:hypothetical protein
VWFTDSNIYMSTAADQINLGNQPPTNANAWQLIGSLAAASAPLLFPTAGPIPFGPSLTSPARNVFHLPSNYLRLASQDQRNPASPTLGTSGGMEFFDWQFEGDYISTATTGVILFRFVADITSVPAMDDVFCEVLAARIGLEVCETLTQSAEKFKNIVAKYAEQRAIARAINAIESGSTEPGEEDFFSGGRQPPSGNPPNQQRP